MAGGRGRHGQWYQGLGARIKAAIERSGMAQTEVAQKMGVTDGAVSRWTTGTAPEPDVLPKLARVLDVSGDYLLGIEPLPATAAPRVEAARLSSEQQRVLADAVRGIQAGVDALADLLQARQKRKSG